MKTPLLATILFAAVPAAFAGTLNLSTGLDASNNLITSGGLSDAHWTVNEQAGGTGAAQTVYPGNADWYGGWLDDGPNSDWIARDASISNNGPAPYTFQVTFSLADTTGASLSGSWAVDDSGTIDLNGNQIGSLGSGAWGGLTSVSDNSHFVTGLNTLSITISSDDEFLEAVRFEGSVTGDLGSPAVPEPASMVLLAGGMLAIAVAKRRRKAV